MTRPHQLARKKPTTKRGRGRTIIENEWDLAVWTSILIGYPGTSITDGAFRVLEEVQKIHQEKQGESS